MVQVLMQSVKTASRPRLINNLSVSERPKPPGRDSLHLAMLFQPLCCMHSQFAATQQQAGGIARRARMVRMVWGQE